MDKEKKIEYIIHALQMFYESRMVEHLNKYYGIETIRSDIAQYDEVAQFVLENLK